MKTVLVAGINGFVGHHLARELHAQGHGVIGTGLDQELDPTLKPFTNQYIGDCDLTDVVSVRNIPLQTVDAVINLAGLAQVGASFSEPEKYRRINVAVHTQLAEAIQASQRPIRVVAVSTGAVYDVHQPMPLSETAGLINHGSPYALSKIAMEAAMKGFKDDGLDVVIARPFNHIGPGQLGGFIVPDLANQVMAGDAVSVGDLSTERDYTDVRDVVRAYVLLATQPTLRHDVYNICSGKSISGRTLLSTIAQCAGRPDVKIVPDPKKIRPDDPKKIVGDSTRLRSDTGWQPQIPLQTTISDYINAARP